MSWYILIKNIGGIFHRFKWAGIFNIVGMSVAFVAFTLIVMQVNFELTYNGSFSKADRLYTLEINESGKLQATLPIPLYEEILTTIPEIKSGSFITSTSEPTNFMVLDKNGNKSFYPYNKNFADTSIVDLFDFEILVGDAKEALSNPDKILIPQSVAKKWFGNENPLNKQVSVTSNHSVTGLHAMEVGAVYKDLPANSSVKNDIYSLSFHTGRGNGNWNYVQFYEISEDANLEEIAKKIE
ncbi:MAG: ABC transporter permease [Odoribacter sp.]|nr:ABC transporter permease [Odoribacter sp.]